MSKVQVDKYESGVSITIEDANGTLNLSKEQSLRLIERIEKELGLQKEKKIVKLRVPVKYLSETAKEEDKETFKVYKAIADDIALKGYGAIVFPAVRDDNGNPLFDLEVL